MPVPKRKRSRARKYSRFANKGISVKAFTYCPNCAKALMTHQACSGCGFYKGAKALATKDERSLKRMEMRRALEQRKQVVEQQNIPSNEPAE